MNTQIGSAFVLAGMGELVQLVQVPHGDQANQAVVLIDQEQFLDLGQVARPGGAHNGTEGLNMLALARGEGQSIIIDGHIEVKIVKWSRSSVRLAIQAPREVTVDRDEIWRKMHPGQRNSLDALCKRYSVDNSHREYHGALLDARILAEVYLAMTGGQAKFSLSEQSDTARSRAREAAPARLAGGGRIAVIRPSEEELAAHEHARELLDKASRGNTVWRKLADGQ